MANKVIGASLRQSIVDQIHDRGNIIARNVKGMGSHLFGQSNTGWALLRSGVDTVTTKASRELEKKSNKDIPSSADLARAAELTGGLLNRGKARSGIARDVGSTTVRYTPSSNKLETRSAAYTTSERQGTRPMSGITSVQINSANTYGTLLNARVTFLVHTLEELEVLELLYMKPGMYCLLEIGHSFFPENSDSGTTRGGSFTPYIDASRERSVVPDTTFYNADPEAIEKSIAEKRIENKHSYEAVFGPVTNFNWEYQSDGSYNCTIDITSKGIILEGLRMAPAAANVPDDQLSISLQGAEQSTAGFDTTSATSGFTHVINALVSIDSTNETISGQAALEQTQQKDAAQKLDNFIFPNFTMKTPGWFSYTKNTYGYISIRTMLDIINKYANLFFESGKPIVYFDTTNGQKFRTYPSHFSSNPLVALKAQAPQGYPDFVVKKGNVHSDIAGDAGADADDIQNIYIGCQNLLATAEQIVSRRQKDPESGVGVVDFVRSILNDVQTAFGNINKFDIAPDRDVPSVFYIVDRGFIEPDDLKTIDLTGLRTTAYNISVKSQIPSSIQSTIAIQAQAGPDRTSQVNDGMKVLNRNVVNRFYKAVGESFDDADTDVNLENIEANKTYMASKAYIEEHLKTFYDNLNAGEEEDTAIDQKVAERLQQNSQIVQQFENKAEFVSKSTMPIPVTIDIEMQGIGGIPPGAAFKVAPGFLPKNYDNVAFMVTTLDHSLDTGNVWKTHIAAQMFLPDNA